jgi:small subunit ribosomal protein S17
MAKERRKVRTGRVVGDKMDKTVVVAVRWQQRHRIYKKSMRRIAKFYAHDKDNSCKLGDVVRIEETRPISKVKHWRVLELVERREVADVKPIDLDEGILTQEADQAEELVLVEELDNEVEEPDDEVEEVDEAKERDLVAELEEDEESLDEVEEPDADEEVDEIEESDVEEIEGAKKAEDEEMGEGAGQEDRS